jgi:mono/diheme cytochrome c family protein
MTQRNRLPWLILLALLAATACGATAIVWRPEFAPVTATVTFPPTDIARGAVLAAVGDCAVCHTAANGRPYAGGRAVPTPFGTVYATNITPDPATGIGRWSFAAFRRAMRDGIDRQGRHLYPVLPYPHFTLATDDDIAAIYAFLMTRAPIVQETPANALAFPLNWRPLLAGWNLLFLQSGSWQPDPARDAEWNRGSYLVEAIGHCGACHTPHNVLGAEQNARALAGGDAEGWDAPALQAAAPAPKGWSVDQLATYLRTGFDAGHGAAAGPMTAVTAELGAVPDADVRAMAVYIASRMPAAPLTEPAKPDHPPDDPRVTAMFDGACGGCHGADAPMMRAGAPPLRSNTAVNAPAARNVVDVILHGLPWREGRPGPYMPAFASALTDEQVASLAAFVRARYSDQPAWPDIAATVRDARRPGGGKGGGKGGGT